MYFCDQGNDNEQKDRKRIRKTNNLLIELLFFTVKKTSICFSFRPILVIFCTYILEDFVLKLMLGRGTFGKVFLAELPSANNKPYAIKAIRKDVLLDFKQVKNTKLEKDILFSCDHPFLVGMDFLFQTPERLYFVMPFIKGGELYKIFKQKKRLPEDVVRFYAM